MNYSYANEYVESFKKLLTLLTDNQQKETRELFKNKLLSLKVDMGEMYKNAKFCHYKAS